jgi:hypothetical protein
LFPSDDENSCFLRTNSGNYNLCVLFELCVLLGRTRARQDVDAKVEDGAQAIKEDVPSPEKPSVPIEETNNKPNDIIGLC